MKFLVLSLSLLIMGCTSVPVKKEFPKPVPELMKTCESLKKVETDKAITITEMLKTIVSNYTLYHECSTKVEGWQEWYLEQKKIHESVK